MKLWLLAVFFLNPLMGFTKGHQTPPKWELGAGALYLNLHHYRGSDQRREYFWPLPYFVYRGEKFFANTTSAAHKWFNSKHFSLSVSFNFHLRVKSANNRARQGMPSLPYAFELGPALQFKLWKSPSKTYRFNLFLPLRTVWTFEFPLPQFIGLFSVPYFAFSKIPTQDLPFFFGMTYAQMIADARYHNHFYGVSNEFATSDRPIYKGKSGYSGDHWTFYLSKRFHKTLVFSFLRYDRLKKATFRDSPLVKRTNYMAVGVAIMALFWQSSEKAKNFLYKN